MGKRHRCGVFIHFYFVISCALLLPALPDKTFYETNIIGFIILDLFWIYVKIYVYRTIL